MWKSGFFLRVPTTFYPHEECVEKRTFSQGVGKGGKERKCPQFIFSHSTAPVDNRGARGVNASASLVIVVTHPDCARYRSFLCLSVLKNDF